MLSIYRHILITAWQVFGFSFVFLFWLIAFPIFQGFTKTTLLLDNVFFPRYRQFQVKEPVFIIGHPRSGTSFLHRLLSKSDELSSFEAWQLIFPALTARVLVSPVIQQLKKKQKTVILPEESGHDFHLDKVEHEEFLFLHQLDTQFAFLLTPLGFHNQEHSEVRLHDQQPISHRQKSMEFFKGCLQRHAFYTGCLRPIIHGHYSTHRIKTLAETFPDAKFIYLIRSPLDTIPSHLSLDYKSLVYLFKLDKLSPKLIKQYFDRRYRYDIELYQYFEEVYQSHDISHEKIMILPYEKLTSQLDLAMSDIMKFIDQSPDVTLQAAVKEQLEKQKHYRRKHENMNMDIFGLTPEQIKSDLSNIFENYQLN